MLWVAVVAWGKENPAAQPESANVQSVALPASASLQQVIDRVIAHQHFFVAAMRGFRPLVETYIQTFRLRRGTMAPAGDRYFLGRLDLNAPTKDRSLLGQASLQKSTLSRLPALYRLQFLPLGFAQMALLDDDLERKYYDFSLVRSEYLGEIRCLVLKVTPKRDTGTGRFQGQIWVEDQGYNIVRFEGTYTPRPRFDYYVHFSSWRMNLQPGLWLPAYIYSEELPLRHALDRKLRFKAQTRLWGYEPDQLKRIQEFTHITVESPEVADEAEGSSENAPVEGQRQWESEAEENAIEQLEKVGLIAPPGPVERSLLTVANRLMVSNVLRIEPPVRIRILLISPLESFTIGHTILLSRGLLDALPDEASLALILAHEIGHISLGHNLDTKFAFNDRMFFPDEDTFERLNFRHNPKDEEAAARKASALIAHSPYDGDLANARLLLRAVRNYAPEMKSLLRPHLGDSLVNEDSTLAASSAEGSPPARSPMETMLPTTGIEVNPWSNRATFKKSSSPQRKLSEPDDPFELQAFPPELTRFASEQHPSSAEAR